MTKHHKSGVHQDEVTGEDRGRGGVGVVRKGWKRRGSHGGGVRAYKGVGRERQGLNLARGRERCFIMAGNVCSEMRGAVVSRQRRRSCVGLGRG